MFAYVLLILFSIQSFEPILIGLNFKLNQDFYASICENKDKPELECKGCCHLKKQLSKNEEEKSTKDKQINKKQQQLYIQEVYLNIRNIDLYLKGEPYASFKTFITSQYSYDVFHPPRT